MIKRVVLIAVFFSTIINESISQSQYLDWAISFGSNTYERGRDIKVDAAGNVITVGNFLQTVDFDPDTSVLNLSANGAADAYVQKLDASGNFVWARSMGGNSTDLANAVAVDDSLNIYTVGFFYATADLDPGSGVSNVVSKGGSDVFIQKLNANGDLVWAHAIGGVSNDNANAVQVTANGIYLVGAFRDTVDFDPGPAEEKRAGNGFYVLKLGLDGTFQWVHTFTGGTTAGNATALAASDSHVYVGGPFIGTVDFDPDSLNTAIRTAGSSVSSDAYVLKLDSAGNFEWVYTSGASGSGNLVFVFGLEVDRQGDVYATGSYSGTVDFDSDTTQLLRTANDDYDVFVQKLSKDGTLAWVNTFGGLGYDYANDLAMDSIGNVYAIGAVTNETDFDGGSGLFYIPADEDCFIQKVDSLGRLRWVKMIKNNTLNKDAFGLGIDIDASNNLYAIGEFDGSADFDPSLSDTFLLSANGSYDVFVQKTNSCGVSQGQSQIESCGPYTWINGVTYFNSDSADYTVATASCDTLQYRLDLTVYFPSIDTTIRRSGDTLIANEQDSSLFQWLDCNNNFAPINQADSASFIPLTSGAYAVEIIDTNGCVDTSQCVQVIIVGLSESKRTAFASKLYPNPNRGVFTLSVTAATSMQISIEVHDLSGKLVLQTNDQLSVGENLFHITETSLPTGLYILSIQGEHYHSQHKLLVLSE